MNGTHLGSKWRSLKNILESMVNTSSKLRPTCAQILKEKKWQISKIEIQKYELLTQNYFGNMQDKFFENYFIQEFIH